MTVTLRRQIGALVRPWRERRHRAQLERTARRAVADFARAAGTPHDLPGELVISLTSFPPRYPTLPNTLKCLIGQSVKPDRIVLWIAHADHDALTPEIHALSAHGVQIERCDDVRSYNKIVHSIARWPDAFIVTVDDDLYYPDDLIARLTAAYRSGAPAICARRAHRIVRMADGRMAPYGQWEMGYLAPAGAAPSTADLFPTGVGGVLYPPKSLSPEVTDSATFKALCPTADDLWLYWMGRRAGSLYRQTGPVFTQMFWDGSQAVSLYEDNSSGGNDRQIAALEAHFGPA